MRNKNKNKKNVEDRNKMKLILKLAEKPRNKDFRFSKLTVKGVDTFGRDIFFRIF